MGVEYNVYLEAKVNNSWVNIDYYCKDLEGQVYMIPAVEAMGIFEQTIDTKKLKAIDISEVSSNTRIEISDGYHKCKQAHTNLFTIQYTDLIDLLEMRCYEYYGFASKYEVKLFENRKIDEIEDWIALTEFTLMDKIKQDGYMYYEWIERRGKFQYFKKLFNEIDNRMESYQSKVLMNSEQLNEKCNIKRQNIRLIIGMSISYCIADTL